MTMSAHNTQTKGKNGDRPAQAFKDSAQQSAAQGKELADKTEAAAATVADSAQHSYENATSDAADFNAQWIEMVRANTNASLDFAHQLIAAKSPSEALELMAAHTRRQFESFMQQSQQLTDLSQKAVTGAVKPMQDGMKKAFDKAA
jgi:phasin